MTLFGGLALSLAGNPRVRPAYALGAPPPAWNGHPDGAAIVRVLGARATKALAPTSRTIGALVAIPPGQTAAGLGVEPFAPGIGRLHATPDRLLAFADAHPGVQLEVSPPLRALMPEAKKWVHVY